MKLNINDALRQLGFPEDTLFNPPPRKVVTKGAPKRVSYTPKVTSTGRIPSTWERVDSQNPDSQSSQPKSKVPKSKSACLGTYSRSQASTPTSEPKPFLNLPYISQMSMIMRPFIEEIVNVKGDDNCGFRVIARHMEMDEENHVLVCHAFIHELKSHKSDYLPMFGTEKRYNISWMVYTDMSHIIETCCNSTVVQLILLERCICETYFPIRGAPRLNSRPLSSCFFERRLFVTTTLCGIV